MKQIIREVVSVITGILIALFINNWNDERKEKAYLDQIFSSIDKELEDSVADIQRVIPAQMASIDTLNAYMDDATVSLYEIVIRSKGVYSPIIKTNSWNAIAPTKIELIEYERLSALADIAERKENLLNRIEKQMDFTFQNFESTDKNKKEILRMMLWDVVGAEQRLLARIEEIIETEPDTTATN